VGNDWPIARTNGLPKSHGPIDHLVCVADADKAHEIVDAVSLPRPEMETTKWVDDANELWTTQLREVARTSPEHVHGRFLRWNRESLVLSGFDLKECQRALGCRRPGAIEKFLDRKRPNPRSQETVFPDEYRKPFNCISEMLVACGIKMVKKNDIRFEDVIRDVSKSQIDTLARRVPDLESIARTVVDLGTEA
jgi:hypothetical protein